MNAFFASCEQHRSPQLRGRPVAITPTNTPNGCIVAASYEAKQHGVTTGWRVGDAKRAVPGIAIIETDHRYYMAIHERLKQFLIEEITPQPVTMSVDEFAIPLDKREQWSPNAHALALRIKQRMCEIFSPSIRCSIGIGPNRLLAKLGTELQKPDGLTFIQLHTLDQAFASLSLRDIPGINWGMSKRLHELGISTPVEFFQTPREILHQALGILGDAWWYNLHGYRVDHVTSPTKSISHSHVLEPELRTKANARAVLYKLCLKVAERLRHKRLTAKTFVVAVRNTANIKWVQQFTLCPTQDVFRIFQAISQAYDTAISHSSRPFKIVVAAYDLQPHTEQTLPLFTDNQRKNEALFTTVDAINGHFGRWTIKPASLLPIADAAPNRITFRAPDHEMD